MGVGDSTPTIIVQANQAKDLMKFEKLKSKFEK